MRVIREVVRTEQLRWFFVYFVYIYFESISSFCFDQEASVMRPIAHVDYDVSKLMQKMNANIS